MKTPLKMLSCVLFVALAAACSAAPLRSPATAGSVPIFDAKALASLPVFEAKGESGWVENTEMVRLWKSLGVSAIDFDGFQYLIPRKFHLTQNTETRGLIDDLVMELLSAPTARKSFCFLATDSVQNLSAYLGISRGAAVKAKALCASTPISAAEMQMFTLMKTEIVHGAPPAQKPKKFLFLLSDVGPAPIEGFTTRDNTTLFVVTPAEFTREKLLRLLAHELAVSYDQFARLAYPTDKSTWETGLAIVFGQFETPGKNNIFEVPANQDPIRCALRDPAIRYALVTERAFRFEDQIAAELKTDSERLAVHGTCHDSLSRWIPVFPLIFDSVAFEMEEELNFFADTCGEASPKEHPSSLAELDKNLQAILDRFKNPSDPRRQHFLHSRMSTINDTTLTYLKTGKTINLCDLLRQPEVGAHYPDLSGGGPRPRIGGW